MYGVKGRPIDTIVLELLELGSLQNYLRNEGEQISLRDQIHWCSDIISGLDYLASKSVIHRDIAARNILLNCMKIAKIGDFGMAYSLGKASKILRIHRMIKNHF